MFSDLETRKKQEKYSFPLLRKTRKASRAGNGCTMFTHPQRTYPLSGADIKALTRGMKKQGACSINFLTPHLKHKLIRTMLEAKKYSPRRRKNSRSILTFGVVGAFFMLVFCVGLAVVFVLSASDNNRLASNCFDLVLNGKQFCFPSQAMSQATGYPILSETTAFPTQIPVFSATSTITSISTVTLTPSVTSTPTVLFIPTNSTHIHSLCTFSSYLLAQVADCARAFDACTTNSL